MTAAAHLSSFYSAAPIVLWVEDAVTRDYLTKVWGEPTEIAFFIAGNNTAVRPVVDTARSEGIGHAFGLVDRDFGHTNFSKWATADVFYLSRHEIENYSLDANTLAGCSLNNRGRTQRDIAAQLREFAEQQPAWLACRRVLDEIRRDLLGAFPEHPRIAHVASLADAEHHIISSDWFAQIAGRATNWTVARVNAALTTAEADFRAALADGTWVESFSGKELFRRIREYVYQPKSTGPHDSDFAKAIGEWQLANGRVPADLLQLRASLRTRVGLLP